MPTQVNSRHGKQKFMWPALVDGGLGVTLSVHPSCAVSPCLCALMNVVHFELKAEKAQPACSCLLDHVKCASATARSVKEVSAASNGRVRARSHKPACL